MHNNESPSLLINEITTAQARKTIKENNFETIRIKKNSYCYSCNDDNQQLKAILIASTPLNKSDYKKYRYEITALYFINKNDNNNMYITKLLLEKFKNNNIVDFFIYNSSSNIDLSFLQEDYNKLNDNNGFEWHNDNCYHYLYKITASDSNKYYLGRRVFHAKNGEKPTINNCLNDGYYGSGGVIYQHWKNKHHNNLVKEIIEIYDKWGDSVVKEEKLIGDKYKNDDNCLNSVKQLLLIILTNTTIICYNYN